MCLQVNLLLSPAAKAEDVFVYQGIKTELCNAPRLNDYKIDDYYNLNTSGKHQDEF